MIQDLVASTASLRADVSAHQNGPSRSYASTVAAAAVPGPSTGMQLQQRQQMTNKRQQVQNRPQENDNSGTRRFAAENDTDPTNDGYQTVQKKKSRSQPSRGSANQSDVLAAGPTKFMVQITNVNPNTTDDDIKTYIQTQDANIEPEEIKDTSSADFFTKRFLITFKSKDFETVMSNVFWPEKIYYKQWYPPRAKSPI